MCEAALSEFLTEIHEAKNVDFQAMVSILVAYCSSDGRLSGVSRCCLSAASC